MTTQSRTGRHQRMATQTPLADCLWVTIHLSTGRRLVQTQPRSAISRLSTVSWHQPTRRLWRKQPQLILLSAWSSSIYNTAGPRTSRSTQSRSTPFETLSLTNGCLFYGHRVVIPTELQPQVLQILHLGHFGM